MNTKTKYERVYDKLCSSCPNAKYCHDECVECDKFWEEMKKKPNAKRYEKLTQSEKCQIYNMVRSGNYYTKEVKEKFRITDYTIRRVIDEINTILCR